MVKYAIIYDSSEIYELRESQVDDWGYAVIHDTPEEAKADLIDYHYKVVKDAQDLLNKAKKVKPTKMDSVTK